MQDYGPILVFENIATCPVCSCSSYARGFTDEKGWNYCSASCLYIGLTEKNKPNLPKEQHAQNNQKG